jgi:branched-chain amino acid transport system substrate-binding protein
VADQAEALGVPCVSNDCPWQAYYFGRGATPDKPFTWTYHFFWGLEDVTANFVSMWNSVKTNKIVGEMWPNDADGLAWSDKKTGQPPLLTKAGYKFVDGGRYQDASEDFTPQISKFKGANCDIMSGVMIPPDFTNFWKQAYQQGFKPKMATVGKALLFPSSLEALGSIGYGLTTECWWSPNHPFKSSLTGQTCKQFADLFTSTTKKQWTQPLLHYAVFEVVADALKRTKNVDDKQAILDAIKATNLDTICGNVNWQAGPPQDPVPNVSKTPLVGGQWIKGDQWPYDLKVVTNVTASMVPVQQKVTTIKY